MEESLSYAHDEDSWDGILEGFCGVGVDQEGGSWGTHTRETWEKMMWTSKKHQRRRLGIAQRMHEIVVEEKRLAEVEKKARVRAKRKAYKERRQERLAKKEAEGRE